MSKDAVIKYCRDNEGLEIRDVFKFLYQSCFGCEHLISDPETVHDRIRDEMQYAESDDLPDIEMLDGDFCRVHLKAFNEDNGVETLTGMFLLSAQKQEDGMARLQDSLEELPELAYKGLIPFDKDDIQKAVTEWQDNGFSPVHHSVTFRERHHPAYRVVKKELLKDLHHRV
ncbi:MAG: hypothetical protein Q4E54_00465 [Lachnospiraceae bacterium]|nr:hypothetical protein [Lachnospiraceae bacterium]